MNHLLAVSVNVVQQNATNEMETSMEQGKNFVIYVMNGRGRFFARDPDGSWISWFRMIQGPLNEQFGLWLLLPIVYVYPWNNDQLPISLNYLK